MSVTDTIGVVGLGNMGGAMARHFSDEGWSVVGYDVDRSKRTAVEADGIESAASPSALAGRVAVVLTSLPTTDAVEAVYLGNDGIEAGAREDLIALEMSTVSPETSETIAASTTAVTVLDAPVSGGPEKARDGTLTVMVGGPTRIVESDRVQTVLDVVGANSYHLGSIGSGHTTKLLNNQIGAGVRAAFFEAAAVAAAREVDWDAFMQVVRHSSGSSYEFRKRMPRLLNRDFEPGFDMETSKKDVRLALEMANAIDAPTVITSVVYDLYKRAIAAGYGDEDIGAVIKLFEETTGVRVESDQVFDEDYLNWQDI